MTSDQLFILLRAGLVETLIITLGATLLAYLLGLPLGLLLYSSSPRGLRPRPLLYQGLGLIVNLLRSIPFLILMVYIIPLTRAVVGTSLGYKAATFALFFASFPFVARLVENSLLEVPQGVIDAGRSMGASNAAILVRILVPEARTSLLTGAILATTNILSWSAMAGFVGAGGLGTIAINYGYNRYNYEVMTWTVLLLVLLVQIFQFVGNRLVRRASGSGRQQ